jgi:hypothetical protein
MMMMKRRRKLPLSGKGSNHLLRLHIKVKGDPLPMKTRLRRPRIKRRNNKSLKLKKPHRRTRERGMKEGRRRNMKRKHL